MRPAGSARACSGAPPMRSSAGRAAPDPAIERRVRLCYGQTLESAGRQMTEAKAKDHYSFEELMACARGEMYGLGNAQLPAPPMLLFDRITKINDTGGAHGLGYI